MNTNEQAPDSCPFCGAGIHAQLNSNADFVNFACDSAWSRGEECQRELQSGQCADAERERLTRERDEARDRVESLENVLSRMLATDGGDGVWSASRFYEARQDAVALMKEARREWRKRREG